MPSVKKMILIPYDKYLRLKGKRTPPGIPAHPKEKPETVKKWKKF